MKQVLTFLFSLSILSSFSQIGTFKKVETNELKLRTMLNSDITKFLTTDANGKVVLATVSGGVGAASRFGYPGEDNTSDVDRLINFNEHALDIVSGTADYSGETAEYYQDHNSVYIASYLNPQEQTYLQLTTSGGGFHHTKNTENGRHDAAFSMSETAANIIVQGDNAISNVFSVQDGFFLFIHNDPSLGDPTAGATEHSDNSSAISAGLPIGAIYRTGDVLKIVH